MNFSDAEDTVNDTELQEPRDEALETELSIADRYIDLVWKFYENHYILYLRVDFWRWAKKEIRLLENSLGRWQVLVESVVGGVSPDFDKQTLAVLRGRLVRYLMRSREVW